MVASGGWGLGGEVEVQAGEGSGWRPGNGFLAQ